MFATGNRVALLFLLLAGPVAAEDDAPAIHQAKPHFYNAIAGRNFSVTWSAQPTTLSVDAELILTLIVDGVVNPHRVRRPDLAAMPPFKANFRPITAVGDPTLTATSVTFVYRLRPRDEAVHEVPELEYEYYSPGTGKTATKYADAIPLQVTPATVVPPAAVPLDAPERFFRISAAADLHAGPPAQTGLWHWLGLLVAMILAVLAGVAFVRWRNPDGRRLAGIRRNRAVRATLDALDFAPRTPDPLAHATTALRRYFVTRHGLLASPVSASELEAAFASSDVPAEKIAAAVELFRKIDAIRFGGVYDNGLSLVAQGRELVLTWEGVA